MTTHAAVVSANGRLSLGIEEISLDWRDIECAKERMQNDGRFFHLNMSPGTAENVNKMTVFYRTMTCLSKKIENALIGEVKKLLSIIKEEIQFINKAVTYVTIVFQCVDEATIKKYSLMNIKMNKCWCFPVYLGRRMARTRTGAIHPDIKPVWVVAALTKVIKLEHKIVSANKTKILNWWGYGLKYSQPCRKK